MTVADAKQRAMGGADDVLLGKIEELALDPVQGPPRMGAGIDVAHHRHAPAHDEDRAVGALEPLAAGIGDLIQPAERFTLAHPGPASQTKNCASPRGLRWLTRQPALASMASKPARSISFIQP